MGTKGTTGAAPPASSNNRRSNSFELFDCDIPRPVRFGAFGREPRGWLKRFTTELSGVGCRQRFEQSQAGHPHLHIHKIMSADEKRKRLAFAIAEFLEAQKSSFADEEKQESLGSEYFNIRIKIHSNGTDG